MTARYLDDSSIEEIWINEPSQVFVARVGTAELTNTILTADEVRDLVERMLKSSVGEWICPRRSWMRPCPMARGYTW